jgi:hypothetical protein
MNAKETRALVLVILATCARCAPGRPPVVKPTPGVTARLELKSLSPAAGTQLSKGSVIVATLAYQVVGRPKGALFLIVQAATDKHGETMVDRFSAEKFPTLSEAQGTVELSFAVAHVWEMARIRHPLKLWFYINERTGPKTSVVIATVGPIEFAE